MLQVIYIPGLGDRRITFQRLAVKSWRLWGVAPQVFHMRWYDDIAYTDKADALVKLIDHCAQRGSVALVGSSAGASAVINAYAKRQNIQAVVCIAGKINNLDAVGESYKKRSPSFWGSIQQTKDSLMQLTLPSRRRILSIRARADEIVPARDSIVADAYNRRVWTMGHAITIAWQLVFGAPSFLRFAKQQNSNDTL